MSMENTDIFSKLKILKVQHKNLSIIMVIFDTFFMPKNDIFLFFIYKY